MATTTARKYPRIDDAEIARLRAMSVDDTLTLLGLYAKLDRDYQPHKSAQSKRVNVSVDSTVIELVVTGAKWYDARAQRGGGGAIDLTMHLYREPFVKAVQRLQARERALQ
ncbi:MULTISPECIES: hypothetical protein [Betaproteobacteria]|jgi:hypothetical protein|uniref:Uncharacterized protein n=1 Tax=bioreactor metagenome TaxID=1076179 RepID=A0A645CM19_9ZZZZ|nr:MULTISPECIES: hypothetical protein [Betaproteobacteria]